jgi:hypothetical protein
LSIVGLVFRKLLYRSSRLACAARLFLFLLAWGFLDTLCNLRYPGSEPTFWYPLPSIDVVVLLALLLVARVRNRAVPAGVRFALVVLLIAVRVFRAAEGAVESHFHRPLNLYLDVPLVPNLIGLMRSTVPAPRLIAGALLTTAAVIALGVLTWQALVIVERALAQRAARGLLAAILLVCALLSPLWSPRHDPQLHVGLFGTSAVPRLAREVSFLRHAGEYRRAKSEVTARTQADLRAAPHGLGGLHGTDVLLVLVESYGETVMAKPAFARRMRPVLDGVERELGAHGFATASGLLASSTYGGRSWLAHATLRTGVRVEDGLAYAVLLDSRPAPLTMAGFFRAAGYRTVLVQPGTTARWPEGLVAGFAQKYYAMDLDYHGPAFKWATMPDQYVMDFVDRHEVARAPGAPARPPLFVEYALVSSHSPWSLQPRLVPDWDRLRDSRIFNDQIEPVRFPVTWSGLQDGGDAYLTSLIYDFDVLRTYLSERLAGGTLVILIGDHQPSAEITDDDPSHGVPIHALSRDHALVERFVEAGFARGMWPQPGAPLPMERFLPLFLRMFSTPAQAAAK